MSDQVRFQCTTCRCALAAPARKAGRIVHCPKCGNQVQVPLSVGNGNLPPQLPPRKAVPAPSPSAAHPSDTLEVTAVDRASKSTITLSRSVIYAQGALIAIVGMVGLLLGLLVAGKSDSDSKPHQSPLVAKVHFRLMRTDAQSNLLPDDGALIFIFPTQLASNSTITIHDRDFTLDHGGLGEEALKTLTAVGGAFARTDEQGDTSLTLSKAGPYHVLLLSRRTKRPTTKLAAEDLKSLQKFFEQPQALLGDLKYRWFQQELSADQKLVHDFGLSGK